MAPSSPASSPASKTSSSASTVSSSSSGSGSSSSSGGSASSAGDSEFVTLRDPVPGFAIKTYVVEGGDSPEFVEGLKVFINVCSHKRVPGPKGLVEERDDIVLSRQFVLPKLAARGVLEETKVPRAMLETPVSGGGVAGTTEDNSRGQDFFGGTESIASILQKQRDQESALSEAVIPAIESTTGKAVSPTAVISSPSAPTVNPTSKKILIQEIASLDESAPPALSYKQLSERLYEVHGCSEEFAESASVVYLPQTHALLLKSSVAFETLTVPIAIAAVPVAIRASYSKKSGALRILVTPRS